MPRDVSRMAARHRRLTAMAALLLALLTQGVLAGNSTGAPAAARVEAVDSIALTVSDLDRAADFYSRVLTFAKVADREVAGEPYERLFGVFGSHVRVVRMRLGDECIELMQFLARRGRPIPLDSRSNDRWFQHVAIVVSDMSAAYARLRSFNVEHASSGPQRLPDWNPSAGGIEAFYFRDPDGHNLELIAFPAGKGLPHWHDARGRLFLGIDHTAIAVADTRASLRFYRDVLGLRVAGSSENYGTEQEHLNNVFGAHLRITSLRAAQGPGVELLEYLAPRTGRAMPADSLPNDLWYWQITMRTKRPGAIASAIDAARAGAVSPHTVQVGSAVLGWDVAVIARDPDGHASLLAGSDAARTDRATAR